MTDALSKDAAKAKLAGLSYGKWKASQPVAEPTKQEPSDNVPICKYCGKRIVDRCNQNRLYCNDACRNNAWYQHRRAPDITEKKCECCGRLFLPSRITARFCSHRCSSRSYYYRKNSAKPDNTK